MHTRLLTIPFKAESTRIKDTGGFDVAGDNTHGEAFNVPLLLPATSDTSMDGMGNVKERLSLFPNLDKLDKLARRRRRDDSQGYRPTVPSLSDFDLNYKSSSSARSSEMDVSVKSHSPYSYQPLQSAKEIRLLRLHEDGSDSRMRCSILHTSLEDDPRIPNYTALSYAWGETSPDGSHLTDVLPCDEGELRITRTLSAALISVFRNKGHGSIFLWVDGVCINQIDRLERARQVALMPEIYSNCADVIVWLGDYSGNTRLWLNAFSEIVPTIEPKLALERNIAFAARSNHGHLFRLLQHTPAEVEERLARIIQRGLSLSKYPGAEPSSGDANHQQLYERHRMPRQRLMSKGELNANRQSWVELTQRDWFRRKWVIQEMAQTRQKRRCFLIGDSCKTFEEMKTGIGYHSLNESATPMNAQLSDRSLLENLKEYQNTRVSEPLDHVYALIGLSNDAEWLKVDYSQDPNDLYRQVAIHYCFHGSLGGSFEILALATAHRTLGRSPSWVPDWRQPFNTDRSVMHADVMKTISYKDRQLWSHEAVFARPMPFGASGLACEAWIVPNCGSVDLHASRGCLKCELLSRPLSSKSQGKQSIRSEAPVPPGHTTALSARQAAVRQKYSSIIDEQFSSTMFTHEVLCLFDHCAIGFVLHQAQAHELPDPADKRLFYRLEFCFQIDEEGWVSNWFADALSEIPKQKFFIV